MRENGDGRTRDSTVSGQVDTFLHEISERASFHKGLHDGTVLHPSIEEKGMTTMRLHRLHFSSRLWPLTFAMSWPHSQRVSVVSDGVVGEEPVSI